MQHVYPNIAAKSFATQDTLFPFDNSYVHVATCRLAEIFVGSFENVNPSTNDLQFYVLRESFHWNLDQHTVSRYEPFAEKVGSFHHQLIEAGIWDLWIQLLSERYAKRTSELVTNRLSFDDLISLWFILLSGFVISGAALFYPPMNTIGEFLDSDLQVKMTPETLEYMQFFYPNIASKAFVEPVVLFPFDNTYAHLATCSLAEIFAGSNENFDSWTRTRQFYILRESFHWNLVQLTVSRYEPFAEKVGSFHTQLIEAGIWDLWIQLLSDRYAKKSPELVTSRLSFDDLISLWFILLSGFTSQEVGADVEVQAGVRPRRLHRIQQIFSNFYLESESLKSGIFGELKSSLTSYPASRIVWIQSRLEVPDSAALTSTEELWQLQVYLQITNKPKQ
ncbi:conserved hypothetical protein [Culex quinquefasciatus]|uniref:Uncharacterized protein n=1 Tax=Culex quinquefasciatus TaxID=7176 RepID=B0XI72_CULQU|nr:conserved hypothetical protein [Culex quinquefasciatus]|eukprot:XP_001869344.1 conserved hypothetical protein [Culex quinquefasciatus]